MSLKGGTGGTGGTENSGSGRLGDGQIAPPERSFDRYPAICDQCKGREKAGGGDDTISEGWTAPGTQTICEHCPSLAFNGHPRMSGSLSHTPRKYVFATLSLLLFGVPSRYIKRLVAIENQADWCTLMRGMRTHWLKACLTSLAVLLAGGALVNLPFLQHTSILLGSSELAASAGMGAGFLAVICSGGGAIASLLLIRVYSGLLEVSPILPEGPVAKPCKALFLSIIFSLPAGLLYWSLLAYGVEVLIICFNTQNIVQIAVYATMVLVLFLLLVIYWWIARGSRPRETHSSTGGDIEKDSRAGNDRE